MTGTICSVATCKSNSLKAKQTGEKIMFFNFPQNPQLRKEWVRKCYRKDYFNSNYKRICSKRFKEDDFEDLLKARLMKTHTKKLKATAVPSLHILPETNSIQLINSGRIERAKNKIQKELVNKLITESTSNEERLNLERDLKELPSTSIESDYDILQKKYNILLQENEKLKRQIEEGNNRNAVLQQKNSESEEIEKESNTNIETQIKQMLASDTKSNRYCAKK